MWSLHNLKKKKHKNTHLKNIIGFCPSLCYYSPLWNAQSTENHICASSSLLPETVIGQRETLYTSANCNLNKSLFNQHDCSLKDQPNLWISQHQRPTGTTLRAMRELLHLSQDQWPASERQPQPPSVVQCQNVNLIQHGETNAPPWFLKRSWCQGWFYCKITTWAELENIKTCFNLSLFSYSFFHNSFHFHNLPLLSSSD